jgi:hypothetical protein
MLYFFPLYFSPKVFHFLFVWCVIHIGVCLPKTVLKFIIIIIIIIHVYNKDLKCRHILLPKYNMYFPPQSLENITLYVSAVKVQSSPHKPCIQCFFPAKLSITWNTQGHLYTLYNNNQMAWNFLSPTLEVTWHTGVIIIWVLHSCSVFHSLQSFMPHILTKDTNTSA